ncbi:hypothetical protein JL09_g5424 [Pichia kudriavzevii]|uniref:Uncharacterized protein n=1 Tax=Pichia kudriavzevii TaxID=4909 RepID=A0A099NU87_PICKU|nr:hypothetical protein JL09_g5424 [Pichia kudriavzevii]
MATGTSVSCLSNDDPAMRELLLERLHQSSCK